MTITLIFLAALLFVFVGWLLSRTINVRPWQPSTGDIDAFDATDRLPAFLTGPRLGLLVFLAAITSLFALTISAYAMRMEVGNDWASVPLPGLLWGNTAVLLLASVGLQWAWNAARREQTRALRQALALGGGSAIAFILGQYLAWRQMHGAGYALVANPANSFFYFVTALHALHLLGGLVAWGRTLRSLRQGADTQAVRTSVELCAWYWHYLLVIWLVLFGLLLGT